MKGRESMTELEKDEVFTARYKGQSYSEIASALSVSTSTIRTYCCRNGLTDADVQNNSVCCVCRKQITQKIKGRRRVFCSDKCRSSWRRSHNKLNEPRYHHTCEKCGKEFYTCGNKNQRFCSRACYFKSRYGGAS